MCVWGMCKIEGGKKEEVGWSEGDRGAGRAE
jgi:hypothetical protein